MTKRLQDIRIDARISNSPLTAMLRSIGIEPIPQELVEAHMEHELQSAPASTMLGRFLYRHGFSQYPFDEIIGTVSGFVMYGGAVAVIISILIGVAIWAFSGSWPSPCSTTAAIGACCFGAGLGFLVSVMWGLAGFVLARGPAYWRISRVQISYGLPRFAADKLLLIDKQFPDHMHFEIAELRQDSYMLDPVLFALYGGERLAICVWKDGEEIHLI